MPPRALEAKLKAIVDSRGLQRKVDFLGWVGEEEKVAYLHACEMLVGSGTRFIIDSAGLILLPEVERYIAEGHVPAGTLRNRKFRIQCIENSEQHGDELYNLLFDPQTSGGLLFALPEADAHSVIERMRDAGVSAFRCGTVESGGDTIQIIPRT